MGRAFSSLAGFLRRSTNLLFGVFGVEGFSPVSNHPYDVDSRQDENKDSIQIEDRRNGDDSALHRKQGDVCVKRGERGLIESSNAVTCTNNIEIAKADNVVSGDNTTINVAESERRKNTTMVHLAVEPEERNTANEETQLSTRSTVTNNITVQNPYIVTIGSVNLQNGDPIFNGDLAVNPDLQEALSFDPNRATDSNIQRSVRLQLFPSPLQLPSAGVEPPVTRVLCVMCTIVDQLYPLRDRGEWLEFEKTLLELQTKHGRHPAIKCFLLLEESVKLTYQKSLKEAKRKAKECLNIVNNEESAISGASQDVLTVLGKVASASILRRLPQKLGKASKCLEDAKESGERLKNVDLTMAKFALALLDYEQARCLMAFAKLTNATKHCNKEATCRMLGRCIDRCRKLSDEGHLYTARQSFALLYLARLSLPATNCHSQPAHFERVKKGSARKAEKHLEEYHRSHPQTENSPVAATVKYLMTRSELCFMKSSYALAKKFASQALQIADKYGFELETVPAQTYLDQISRHCASTTRQNKLPVVKALPSGYSSSTSTDSDQKYTALTGSQRET